MAVHGGEDRASLFSRHYCPCLPSVARCCLSTCERVRYARVDTDSGERRPDDAQPPLTEDAKPPLTADAESAEIDAWPARISWRVVAGVRTAFLLLLLVVVLALAFGERVKSTRERLIPLQLSTPSQLPVSTPPSAPLSPSPASICGSHDGVVVVDGVEFCANHSWLELVHIPKCAGYSLLRDLPLPLSAVSLDVSAWEKCLLDEEEHVGQPMALDNGKVRMKYLRHKAARPALRVALFRKPREHVLSQYVECRYDAGWKDWQRLKPHTDFPDGGTLRHDFLNWLRHFTSSRAPVRHNDYGCCARPSVTALC